MTIRDFALRYTLHVGCDPCQKVVPLNLEQLADRVGWDARFLPLRSRLKCHRCGGREVRFVIGGVPDPTGMLRGEAERTIARQVQRLVLHQI